MDRYSETLERLRGYEPSAQETDRLKEKILRSLPEERNSGWYEWIAGLFFGWTEVLWLRRAMVVFSALITIVFVFQQFTVYERMNSIEERIISITTDNILDFQKETIHASNAIYKLNSELFADDSLMVSGKDLGALVRSYRELQSRYEELQSIIDAGESDRTIEKLPGNEKLKL